jgi:hypothetical protein
MQMNGGSKNRAWCYYNDTIMALLMAKYNWYAVKGITTAESKHQPKK